MDNHTVTLTRNGLGAQVYLGKAVFRHSPTELEPGDEADVDVLEDGRIALAPVDKHDSPVDGTRRDTTGTRRESTGDGSPVDGIRRDTTGYDGSGGGSE